MYNPPSGEIDIKINMSTNLKSENDGGSVLGVPIGQTPDNK